MKVRLATPVCFARDLEYNPRNLSATQKAVAKRTHRRRARRLDAPLIADELTLVGDHEADRQVAFFMDVLNGHYDRPARLIYPPRYRGAYVHGWSSPYGDRLTA